MISSLSLSFFFSNNELNLSLRFDTSILIRIDFVVVELKTFPPYVTLSLRYSIPQRLSITLIPTNSLPREMQIAITQYCNAPPYPYADSLVAVAPRRTSMCMYI